MVATQDLESLVGKTAQALLARRRLPEATYRLQFNGRFPFRAATDLVPYLHALGISDCYASPYLRARPGSLHGYDVFDHNALNPEIGGDDDYEAFVAALHGRGMGQLLDVVPNHMGIGGNDNAWWNDVLENGPASPYAGYFDIDWYSSLKPELHEKVLLPVLGAPYGKVLESGQLTLRYDRGAFHISYFDRRFPIDPGTYDRVLRHRLDVLESNLGTDADAFNEYQSILTSIKNLPPRATTDLAAAAERQREKEVVKRRLAVLTEGDGRILGFVEENVAAFNGTVGDRHSYDLLDTLLDDQAYRLSSWRVAADEINYRRFFDVNELAALSADKPDVFEATHALVLRLLREGKVTGVRVDHIDGLYDPKGYLERLQLRYALEAARDVFASEPEFAGRDWAEFAGPLEEVFRHAAAGSADSPFRRPLYLLVEKILGKGEKLPDDWPVHGTTGYEFLNALTGLFVASENADAFRRLYDRWRDGDESFADIVYHKKFLILQVSLSAELHVLAHQLNRLAGQDRWSRDFTLTSLRHALREVIACFPVYRSYLDGGRVHPRDRRHVEVAVARAKRRSPALSESIFDYIRDMLLLNYPEGMSEDGRAALRRFVGSFQQVTGPVMAKGLEDTAFYVCNRLLALNEVGGDADTFGISVAAFHRHNRCRQLLFPAALSTTATHDTKRGEDVRARLAVLSEVPGPWRQVVARWSRLNKRHRTEHDDLSYPDRNDEYLFYQTLVGAWPAETDRLQAYMEKATREAKVHTSWVSPNPAYDDAVRRFVARTLDPAESGAFLADFAEFQKFVAHYGMLNSLSQVLLKVASPGVPDVYQGTELWDLSLVDPDNRRPVDFEARCRALAALEAGMKGPSQAAFARELIEAKEDGRVKMYVLWRSLHARRERPGLFREGDYLPAEAEGSRHKHIVAFVRRGDAGVAVVAAPRLTTALAPPGRLPLGAEVWGDTRLLLTGVAPGTRLRDAFTGVVRSVEGQEERTTLAAADVFESFPVALLLEEV